MWFRRADGSDDIWCSSCQRWIPEISPVHTCYDAKTEFGLNRHPTDTDETYRDFLGGA